MNCLNTKELSLNKPNTGTITVSQRQQAAAAGRTSVCSELVDFCQAQLSTVLYLLLQ